MGLLNLHELAGLGRLGQVGECGPAPALGPGEKSMCCPELGWVIYDAYESPYALCERASAGGGASPRTSLGPSAADYLAASEARRRAADAELDARRREIEDRRLALEERQFQRQLQTALLQTQLRKAAAKKATERAKVEAERQFELSKIEFAEDTRKKEQTRKALTYGAIALAAAKVLALF